MNTIECKLRENFACNCKQPKLNVFFTFMHFLIGWNWMQNWSHHRSCQLLLATEKIRHISYFWTVKYIMRLNFMSKQTTSSYFLWENGRRIKNKLKSKCWKNQNTGKNRRALEKKHQCAALFCHGENTGFTVKIGAGCRFNSQQYPDCYRLFLFNIFSQSLQNNQ